MSARQMKVEVYEMPSRPHNPGMWQWRIVAANGTVIADSSLNRNADGTRFRGYPRRGRAVEIANKVALPLPVVVAV